MSSGDEMSIEPHNPKQANRVLDSMDRCETCGNWVLWFDKFPLSHQGFWELASWEGKDGGVHTRWHPHTPARCRDVKNGYVEFAPEELRTTLSNPDGPQPIVVQHRPDRRRVELALGGPGPYTVKEPIDVPGGVVTVSRLSPEEFAEFRDHARKLEGFEGERIYRDGRK